MGRVRLEIRNLIVIIFFNIYSFVFVLGPLTIIRIWPVLEIGSRLNGGSFKSSVSLVDECFALEGYDEVDILEEVYLAI